MEILFICQNKKLKTYTSSGKLIMTILWGMGGLFLIHFTPNSKVMNSDGSYCELLQELKPKVNSTKYCKLSKVLFVSEQCSCGDIPPNDTLPSRFAFLTVGPPTIQYWPFSRWFLPFWQRKMSWEYETLVLMEMSWKQGKTGCTQD